MKKEQVKKTIREQISKIIKDQNNSNQEEYYDPATTCVGRGSCCRNNKTGKITSANFNQDYNKRITCSCSEGHRKINCSPKK